MAVLFPLSVTHTILISIAYCYANEDEVGEGLKEAFDSGVKREDIFVTTKLWCTYHSRVEEALDKSLKSLGLDYVDLFLVHWPVACNPNGNSNTLSHVHTGDANPSQETTTGFPLFQTGLEMLSGVGHTYRPGRQWKS